MYKVLTDVLAENKCGPASRIHHPILFRMWAMGYTHSLAFSKVPDARRQSVTTEDVSAIRRREEPPQGPYGGSARMQGVVGPEG